VTTAAFDPEAMWQPWIKVYIIDASYNDARTTGAIRAKGGFPVCTFSAGAYEGWRADAANLTDADHSGVWLDVRSANVRAVMRARIAACKAAGFVAVVAGDADAYADLSNGVGLTAADQVDYNIFLAQEAHAAGLGVGLKNDVEQVAQLLPYFDFFVNE
jgi:hypothetical protein